jgi:hypothetical protein
MGSIPADGWIRLGLSNRAHGGTGQTGAVKGAKGDLATGAMIRPFSVVHESALAVNAWRRAGGMSVSWKCIQRICWMHPWATRYAEPRKMGWQRCFPSVPRAMKSRRGAGRVVHSLGFDAARRNGSGAVGLISRLRFQRGDD